MERKIIGSNGMKLFAHRELVGRCTILFALCILSCILGLLV